MKRSLFRFHILMVWSLLAGVVSTSAADLLTGKRSPVPAASREENRVRHRCLTPQPDPRDVIDLGLTRTSKWGLPTHALDANFQRTIRCLVLRFSFQEEVVDDPNTTGNGVMNVSRPLDNPVDSAAYFDSAGHWIDPPPHDSSYFHAHMRALSLYWNFVSEGHLDLSWDIFPRGASATYTLPHPMSYYGQCDFDSVVVGLERYFVDCIQTAEAQSPEINFAEYESIFLFHAGSDRQNDIGFPESCNDLFTGFISFGDSVAVDGDSTYVRTALIMPEGASQDNRATALNAVMAHEFGHQLGLVDLYRTDNFLSQLGDFALMDNNGFGTGTEIGGFTVGRVFGVTPVYPCAWSRAYLGLNPVVDVRQGSDVRVVAAEIASSGNKIARVPISENEYYLLETRVTDFDGDTTLISRVDSTSNVILGPANRNREFTGEYDLLIPGSGMLIFHVDESITAMDFDGDGMNNFDDNDVQNSPDPLRKFVALVEGDGLVNFGGIYRAGFGRQQDMYRDDLNHSFTPNTNPASFDNTGNNTHVYITGITRDTLNVPPFSLIDTAMYFDVETDGMAAGFPVRVGYPDFGLLPIVDDLDRDGNKEVIVASGDKLSVFDGFGQAVIPQVSTCTTCGPFYDTAFSSVNTGNPQAVPIYTVTPDIITAGPATGDYGNQSISRFVAVGFPRAGGSGAVEAYALADLDGNYRADYDHRIVTGGVPIAVSFGDRLYALDDKGGVYLKTSPSATAGFINLPNEMYHGICRLGSSLILVAGDSAFTTFYHIDGLAADSFKVEGMLQWGPVVVDMDRDGREEIVTFSDQGLGLMLTVDESSSPFVVDNFYKPTGESFTSNPIVSDVDGDGYPELVIGGHGYIYAYDRRFTLKANFPKQIDDRFPNDEVVAPPVAADIEMGGSPEIVFPTLVGNVYSYGEGRTYGFPISAGELGAGTPVLFNQNDIGVLGFVGADGWFYGWQVNNDTTTNYWPMGGYAPEGTFNFDESKLGAIQSASNVFDEKKFYCYPNPVEQGATTIRYTLGKMAQSVTLTMYDLSGREVSTVDNPPLFDGVNECVVDCSTMTPGVYRCIIEVEIDGESHHAFTDLAVIR